MKITIHHTFEERPMVETLVNGSVMRDKIGGPQKFEFGPLIVDEVILIQINDGDTIESDID